MRWGARILPLWSRLGRRASHQPDFGALAQRRPILRTGNPLRCADLGQNRRSIKGGAHGFNDLVLFVHNRNDYSIAAKVKSVGEYNRD